MWRQAPGRVVPCGSWVLSGFDHRCAKPTCLIAVWLRVIIQIPSRTESGKTPALRQSPGTDHVVADLRRQSTSVRGVSVRSVHHRGVIAQVLLTVGFIESIRAETVHSRSADQNHRNPLAAKRIVLAFCARGSFDVVISVGNVVLFRNTRAPSCSSRTMPCCTSRHCRRPAAQASGDSTARWSLACNC